MLSIVLTPTLCKLYKLFRDALRAGKRLLKEKNGAASMVRFEKALMLSKALSDRVRDLRSMRICERFTPYHKGQKCTR
jgi:hypothetical protein